MSKSGDTSTTDPRTIAFVMFHVDDPCPPTREVSNAAVALANSISRVIGPIADSQRYLDWPEKSPHNRFIVAVLESTFGMLSITAFPS